MWSLNISNLMLKGLYLVLQCTLFWPVTDSYSMLVKYERSNVVSQHFYFMLKGLYLVLQCTPFWPVTDSYSMLVKYERSNVVSQHF